MTISFFLCSNNNIYGGKDKKNLWPSSVTLCLQQNPVFAVSMSNLRTRTFILSPHSICMSLVAIFDLHMQNELMQMSN